MSARQYVFKTSETRHYRFPTHVNDLVMDRADAETSEVLVVVLEPGEAPPLHLHDDTEQIFYVLEGAGLLEIGEALEPHEVGPGDVVRIPPRTLHRIHCRGRQPMRYLAVDCFLGGRPAAEPTWESHVRTMCAQNGWNIDEVRARESVPRATSPRNSAPCREPRAAGEGPSAPHAPGSARRPTR